jgi:hypothetical protein
MRKSKSIRQGGRVNRSDNEEEEIDKTRRKSKKIRQGGRVNR